MTARKETGAPRLSDEQVTDVIALLKGVDSVELKVSIPAEAHRAAIRGLPLDPVEAELRHVFFLDTPELALYRAGVVVRARRMQGGDGDTVVKLRPVVPEQVPLELRRSGGYTIEVDILPGGFVCSGSLKDRTTGKIIRQAVTKGSPLRAYSKEQRAYLRAHAPEGIDLDRLTVLGPIFVLKSVFTADLTETGGAGDRRMVAEMWLFPDGSRAMELSTKCRPRDTLRVATETRAWILGRDVAIDGAQENKTHKALTLLAAEAARSAPAS